jgi:hypothetical protein
MACSNAMTFVILPHILLASYEKSTNHNRVETSPCYAKRWNPGRILFAPDTPIGVQ